MKLKILNKDKIVVLNIKGRINLVTAQTFVSECDNIINQGNLNILMNFKRVEYISSFGLRQLLRISKLLESQNGWLRICSINGMVREVFELSGLDTLINVYSDEGDVFNCPTLSGG